MKALTICQPYAELIVRGEKLIENRTWWTPYRGPLAIHAGKSMEWWDDGYGIDRDSVVLGAIVGTAMTVACLHIEDDWPRTWEHLRGHEHANGPWCWVLANVARLPSPIIVRGAQGLWEWNDDRG